MNIVYKLIIISVLFILIDYFYLSNISNYFNNQVNLIQNSPITLDFISAGLCYFFLVFGLYYFILKDKKSPLEAFLFGLIIYMVFETTNKALFKNWKWTTVLIDGIWGGILYYSITTIYYYIENNYK
uniref:DUF2177 family protein n=1 Tax=viral metagenome TaxID=1070528 RepID=A0A6C0IXS3_9ZZZZ